MRNSSLTKISGAKTFRASSTKILGRWGSNNQNIEKSVRQIYIPDPGKKFVQVDQSGAEALAVAYLCGPGLLRDLFTYKIKPHTYVALRLFEDVWPKKMREHNLLGDMEFDIKQIIATPVAELKNNPFWKDLDLLIRDSDNWSLTERYYYIAKQTCHSSNYDIMPPNFRMNVLEKSGGKIVISKEDSEKFLLMYHSLFPGIRNEFHRNVRLSVEQTGMLYNLHGHPYTITDYEILDSEWKELYAWIPQSTIGEITHIAYASMQDFIEQNERDWDLLANTHDSYLIQCPPDEELECARVATGFMEQTFKSPVDGMEFTMRADAASGYNWMPWKKDINEDGLRELRLAA